MPTVLITGANRGLGLEFTRQYAADGWRVLAACRDPDGAGDLRALAKDGAVSVHALDVTDFTAVGALAAELKGTAVDVLLNNAGVFGPKKTAENDLRQTFGHIDGAVMTDVFRANAVAPLKMAEAFVEHVASSAQKKIVTITSANGSIARTDGGHYAYRMSKAAANMAMRNLSSDLAPRGIVTAAFCPGWVRTRMGGPQAAIGAPESIAGMRKVIAGLTPETSGQFWLYNGTAIPW